MQKHGEPEDEPLHEDQAGGEVLEAHRRGKFSSTSSSRKSRPMTSPCMRIAIGQGADRQEGQRAEACLKAGNYVLKTWSRTQRRIATRSGEAELIAMQDGAARGMGHQEVMSEMGLMLGVSLLGVLTDSSVAKSFVASRGQGKMSHVEVKLLWLQDVVQSGRLVVGEVKGTANIADALTKYHFAAKFEELCSPHGVVRATLTEAAVGPRGDVEKWRHDDAPGGA